MRTSAEAELAVAIIEQVKSEIDFLIYASTIRTDVKSFLKYITKYPEEEAGVSFLAETLASVSATAAITAYGYNGSFYGQLVTQGIHSKLNQLKRNLSRFTFNEVFEALYARSHLAATTTVATLFLSLDCRPAFAPDEWKKVFAGAAGLDADSQDPVSDAQIAAEQHYHPTRRVPLFEDEETAMDPRREFRVGQRYRAQKKWREQNLGRFNSLQSSRKPSQFAAREENRSAFGA